MQDNEQKERLELTEAQILFVKEDNRLVNSSLFLSHLETNSPKWVLLLISLQQMMKGSVSNFPLSPISSTLSPIHPIPLSILITSLSSSDAVSVESSDVSDSPSPF